MGRRGAVDLQAGQLAELYEGAAQASGGPVYEDSLARLHRGGLVEVEVGGQVVDDHGDRYGGVEALRGGNQVSGRPTDVLGVATLATQRPAGHPLADLETGHAFADGIDNPGDVLTWREGWLRITRQRDRPDQKIEPRHPSRGNLDPHFIWLRLRNRLLDQVQHLGPTALGDDDAVVA